MQLRHSSVLALVLGFVLAAGSAVMADGEKPACAADKPACAADKAACAADKGGCPMAGAKAEAKAQTACPIMGGPINKAIYADYEGKRVYFCCQGCVKQFQKDPAAVLKKLAEQGVTLEAVPAKDAKK